MSLRFEDVGLCCGSVAGADFRGLVEAAGGAGFRSITLWPTHFRGALESGLAIGDMRSLLADHGLTVTELDPLCTWLPEQAGIGALAGGFAGFGEEDFFRIADALGARSLNVIHLAREPVPTGEVVERLASLAECAAQRGLLVSIEFMPWSAIGSLSEALEVVAQVGRPDCGVNIDTWHHFRSGGTVEEIASIDPDRVVAMQLNDVAPEPWNDLLLETATGRMLPGEGARFAGPVLEACAHAGIQVPVNVEVFSAELQQLPPEEAARSIAASVRSLLAGTDRA
jgi:sugar phosphate isomerase/epimerase